MRLSSEKSEDIINLLKRCFANTRQDRVVKIYGIPKDKLKEFMKTNEHGQEAEEPNAQHRLLTEEIDLPSN